MNRSPNRPDGKEMIWDNGGDNDNNVGRAAPATETKTGTSAVAAFKSSTAITSLEDVRALVGKIDTTGTSTSSGNPLLTYSSREGVWQLGRLKNAPDENARWLVNVVDAKHGYVSFDADNNNKPKSVMTPAYTPMPDYTALPNTGFPWNPQKSFSLKCLEGPDYGVEADFKTTTEGGFTAFNDLIDQVKSRAASGQRDLFPEVLIKQDSYTHKKYGHTNVPMFVIVGWTSIDGPEPKQEPVPTPAPKPTSPPPSTPPRSAAAAADQPRRRRVGA
jgi:hypothetical protein